MQKAWCVLAMISCLSSSFVFLCASFRQNFCLEKFLFLLFLLFLLFFFFALFLVSRSEHTIYVLKYSSIEIFTPYILVGLV